MTEDPYADELAQRSAEFARHAAFDDPTPPQGLPQLDPASLAPIPVAWNPPPPIPAIEEPTDPDPGYDPPLAAQLTLGQRFGMAFTELLGHDNPFVHDDEVDERQLAARLGESVTTDLSRAYRPPTADELDPAGPATFEPRLSSRFEEHLPSIPEALTEPEVHAVAPEEPAAEAVEADDLPQRIPAEPDVPASTPEAKVAVDEPVLKDKAQLSRIASHLRREDVPAERPDGFDVQAVLAAVRDVAGIREASMRTTATGAHHLRLELAEGADPGAISRMVARMLQDQMGIDAALMGPPGPPVIPAQAAEQPVPETPSVVPPRPRSGLGAAPPPATENWPDQSPPPRLDRFDRLEQAQREPRRRHPVSVPRRPVTELRPSERAAATWKSNAESEQGASPPALATDRDQGPRAIIEHVQTSTFGLDATVEVRLNTGDRQASGVASGPAVDAYVLRLCAAATAAAVDDLLRDGTSTGETGRCFVEHAALVPMGSCDVAVVVVLLVCGGWVEQLAGSALVSGDPRRAVVRATLSAVNRRLAALLP
ncbi:hypothetical protein Rhe02_85240 [Rhizocola hellebori]|uniref:Uncharacterized protein n=2 Tax=Rhizocola hellebori TaxID=1392758 RepID=A0A8J3QI45_9ACTN|nr:hypothetical protein Rhe02_85240 [Rhizocola hellebori]